MLRERELKRRRAPRVAPRPLMAIRASRARLSSARRAGPAPGGPASVRVEAGLWRCGATMGHLSSMLGHRHHGAASCGGRGWQRRPALLRTEAEQAEGPGHIGLAVERGAAELARHALAAAEHDGAPASARHAASPGPKDSHERSHPGWWTRQTRRLRPSLTGRMVRQPPDSIPLHA